MAKLVDPTPPVVVEGIQPPVINILAVLQISPTWIFVIIGIGTALVILVVVLIVRSMRP